MGNKFRISRFQDGVNRLYEESTYFGFQKHKAIRSMLRFAEKKRLTKAGIEALRAQIEAEPELAKDFGWEEALANPKKWTNVIVYQDATTQGTQLFGIATGSKALLAQGGAYPVKGEFVKAYKLLADKLNEELSIYYTRAKGEVTRVEVFNTKNTKALHMTTLYNVGKLRLLTGKSFGGEELTEEFALSKENDKFISLLETCRLNGLDLPEEDLWEIFQKSIWYVAGDALRAMNVINKCIDDKTLIYKWTSALTGSTCQYAMSTTKPEIHIWCDMKGRVHRVTHHIKVLEAKAKWRGLAARLIQGADADIMNYMLRGEAYLATIHDSFGSHPNDAGYVKERYKEALIRLYESDFLTHQLREITGLRVKSLQEGNDRKEIIKGIENSTNYLMY
jgi:hypothetical protein